MNLKPPLQPMLARLETTIPQGEGWLYEPKWDGFRALIFNDAAVLEISSRNSLPLQRYFPELVTPLQEALPPGAVVDGEIIIATAHGLDFDSLQMRLHPAASRVEKLALATPASVVLFDLLAQGDEDLRRVPLLARRRRLQEAVRCNSRVSLTPQTTDARLAERWFSEYEGAGLDGLIAKEADSPYLHGERGWVKIKHLRTVDCVVGGYRLDKSGSTLGSLLLGLYDDDGVLHHVGHTSSFSAAQKREVLQRLAPHVGKESFVSGRTPGAPSRWSRERDAAWVSVAPKLVCEVSFDHLQGPRFRHAARFLRWREDKNPADCTYSQLSPVADFDLQRILTSR